MKGKPSAAFRLVKLGVVAFGVSFGAIALTACSSASSDGAEGGNEGKIVFSVSENGWNSIWVMDPDGRARTRLTEKAPPGTDAAGNMEPSSSPDGKRIVYVGTGPGPAEDENDRELYVITAVGGERRRLTFNRLLEAKPDWSPDGRRIVFARASGWGIDEVRMGLYTVSAVGSDEQLVYAPESPASGAVFLASPAWSPRGDRIAFTLTRFAPSGHSSTGIFVIRLDDGVGPRLIARDAGEPAWSPDGRRVAFTSTRDRHGRTCFQECAPAGELYVAHADGTGARRLTRTTASDSSPTWSPDGSRILFVSDRWDPDGHEYELYVVGSDGDDVQRLTDNQVWDTDPDWSPSLVG